MASLDHTAVKQFRRMGAALKDATPSEALKALEKMFRMYGEQKATMEDAAGYICIARDSMMTARDPARKA